MFMGFKVGGWGFMVVGSVLAGLGYVSVWSGMIVFCEWELLCFSSVSIIVPIIFDMWGLVFSLGVVVISMSVMLFSEFYMAEEKNKMRFVILVSLFVLCMNMLIFFPSLIVLLLGWDGLGLVSFILVVYYQTPKALGAGMITALMSRVGDVMLLLSIGLMVNRGGWGVFWPDGCFSESSFIFVFIVVAAMTKSAQMPFSSWLPAAMAAPTPVSALVHSSTLVTAGVFLLFRFFTFLEEWEYFSVLLVFIAGSTMMMASLGAMVEEDMKKVVALSTLSQLGVMMLAMGMGVPILAFFHLLTHAFFKALMFLCVGGFIYYGHHSQDLRQMGGLGVEFPLISSFLLVSSLSLMGMPFLAGFYSKDLILEEGVFGGGNLCAIGLSLVATGLTCSYSVRVLINGVWGVNLCQSMSYVKEENGYLCFGGLILSGGGVMLGCLMNWLMVLPVSGYVLPLYIKPFSLIIIFAILIFGGVVVCDIYNSKDGFFLGVVGLLSSMWYLSPVTSQYPVEKMLQSSHGLFKVVDQGWCEMASGSGLFFLVGRTMSKLLLFGGSFISFFLLMSLFMGVHMVSFIGEWGL